ncbi:prepilin peptidase [Actinomycetospora atypica]|uniref:Prepilin peptidase n=1 Tax=Actinomycetospora atypica TaxID=1290095 RepID=A0ABV9YU50_9PSEU
MDLLLDVALGVLLPLTAGGAVGAAVRLGLARARRGVLLAPGWCEPAVATAWGVVGTAAVTGAVAPARVPLLLGASVLAVAGTATDLASGRLPDVVTLPAVPLGWALLLPCGPDAVLAGVLGTLVLGAPHVLLAVVAPRGLRGGDAKLAAALGAPLAAVGWWSVAVVPVAAATVLAVGAALLRRRALPLGPPLLGVTWIVLVAGS